MPIVIKGRVTPSELDLLDLARRRFRKLGDLDHRLGAFERAQPQSYLPQQRRLFNHLPGAGYDERGDRLTPSIMRKTDYRSLQYSGMGAIKRGFDFERRHILSALLDHVLESVFKPKDSVLIEMPNVA